MPSAGYVPFIQSLLCDPISGRPEIRLEHVSPYKKYTGARFVKGGGGGGGGGVHPDYFVKLDFEIAVDQQTRARDRTFEGVSDSG